MSSGVVVEDRGNVEQIAKSAPGLAANTFAAMTVKEREEYIKQYYPRMVRNMNLAEMAAPTNSYEVFVSEHKLDQR